MTIVMVSILYKREFIIKESLNALIITAYLIISAKIKPYITVSLNRLSQLASFV